MVTLKEGVVIYWSYSTFKSILPWQRHPTFVILSIVCLLCAAAQEVSRFFWLMSNGCDGEESLCIFIYLKCFNFIKWKQRGMDNYSPFKSILPWQRHPTFVILSIVCLLCLGSKQVLLVDEQWLWWTGIIVHFYLFKMFQFYQMEATRNG